jgi:hypothetical protein
MLFICFYFFYFFLIFLESECVNLVFVLRIFCLVQKQQVKGFLDFAQNFFVRLKIFFELSIDDVFFFVYFHSLLLNTNSPSMPISANLRYG